MQARAKLDAAVPALEGEFPCLALELKLQHFVELMRSAAGASDQLQAMQFARASLPVPASLADAEMQELRARLLVRPCRPLQHLLTCASGDRSCTLQCKPIDARRHRSQRRTVLVEHVCVSWRHSSTKRLLSG